MNRIRHVSGIALLALASTSGALEGQAASEDSAALRARLELRLSAFHLRWQGAWRESEKERFVSGGNDRHRVRRAPYIHCHATIEEARPGGVKLAYESIQRADTQYFAIASRTSAYAACPTWLLVPQVPFARDESAGRDGALLERLRPGIKAERASVIGAFDSATAGAPRDGWILGQRIRLLVDQGERERAESALRECRADSWWCAALLGLVANERRDVDGAQRAFRRMRETMPVRERCAWGDWRPLLRESERAVTARWGCAVTDSLEEQLWWLSDPLYRDAGNERRVAQEARRVRARLHVEAVQDERFNWNVARGGDALVELVHRFGWPTYTGWGGEQLDESHTRYLESHRDPPAKPYTTFEYAIGRVHTVPSLAALQSPFDAKPDHWSVSGLTRSGAHLLEWWPPEHFVPARPLAQLEETQSILLRRQDQLLLATSTLLDAPTLTDDLERALQRTDSAPSIDVLLLRSPAPEKVDSVAQELLTWGTRAALRAMIPSEHAVVSIEARCLRAACGDARARFGVRAVPTLASMRRGEIAISEPALLEGSHPQLAIDRPREELLDFMRSSVALPRGDRRVGLYWESYGIASTDTVTVSIRVASVETISALRRVGMALNLAGDPTKEVRVQWREPDVARSTRTLVGPVPVQMRSVLLDLRELAPGPYVIETSIQRGATIVRSQRPIVLEDR